MHLRRSPPGCPLDAKMDHSPRCLWRLEAGASILFGLTTATRLAGNTEGASRRSKQIPRLCVASVKPPPRPAIQSFEIDSRSTRWTRSVRGRAFRFTETSRGSLCPVWDPHLRRDAAPQNSSLRQQLRTTPTCRVLRKRYRNPRSERSICRFSRFAKGFFLAFHRKKMLRNRLGITPNTSPAGNR